GVDLEVNRGDFWGILGFNGSGKTALLKTLLGLLPVRGGRRAMHGRPRFGYVPQKERLDTAYPLTARDVAALGACRSFDPLGWLPGRHDGLVRRSLQEAGVLELERRPYRELSGGQRQRVLIARALAAEPDLLMLDEPLAGVDIATQHELLRLLKRLKAEQDLTVLMVSHRVSAEKGLFTHIAWVEDGRVDSGTAGAMLSGGRVGQVFNSEL
ncbi:MAG: ATP-binding cassette domain-containing protein, partial [Elusimicrobia bacterium]|nr:ATP-binding cassette domain-containing protein [Elusimicrobiota bacterium]